MNARKTVLVLMLSVCAAAWSAPAKRDPHIGYLFPAGVQRGSVVEIIVGGQYLRATKGVYISGKGVQATFVKYYRPRRNVMKEQREELKRILAELREKQMATLPEDQLKRMRPWRNFRKRNVEKKSGKDGKSDNDEKGATEAKPVKLPEHPMLRNLESMGLRALQNVANEFVYSRSFKKRQPNAQIAEMALIKVTIDADAQPGDRELRLVTPTGLTNFMCFQVGTLPETHEQEPNDPGAFPKLPPEPAVDLPIVLNGQIMPGDVDRFRFRAKQNQQLVIKTHARRLVPFLADTVPGWFQATVSLYDATGREIAFADDYRFDPDPVLFFKIPADGEYELEIHDSIYRGREDFVYRVAIGELPFITSVFPLGGSVGAKTVAAIEGWHLPRKRLRLDTRPGPTTIRETMLSQGVTSNEVVYHVDTLPECYEKEPNNGRKAAQKIALPQLVNGRISRPGDIDVYAFSGRAGQRIVAEVLGRRLHSPIDSLLRIADASGKVLAWNDDFVQKEGHLHKDMGYLTHHADSYLIVALPNDGVYYAQLSDTQNQGGKAYAYRLRITPVQADFTLLMTPSCLSIPAGRVLPIAVHALRRDGFDGEIELALKEAPPGFELGAARIPRGRSHVWSDHHGPHETHRAPGGLAYRRERTSRWADGCPASHSL